jgi:predicted nucleotidyltransferase
MQQNLKYLTPASLMILRFLSDDPMKEFYQREVAKRAGISVGATNQILRILTEREIVTREKRGRMFFYQYNLQNPVARYLKIFLNINELYELARELKQHCKRVLLFGSAAEGNDVKESDFDLFVLTDDKEKAHSIINRYKSEIGRKISPIVLNAREFVELRSKDKPLYAQILRGIPLWQVE